MWLLPFFPKFSKLVTTTFYRLGMAGGKVPARGPVLLVANHPNSLMDPALVAAVAERPVRFLAKAPLFTDPLVGWLVRGSGAIPVYRRADDEAEVAKNEDSFRTVYSVLAEGAAVAIFPEGISHSQPSLAPLKTGAARIALGASALLGRPIPIVPVGLTFRRKDTFRSEALAVVGEPVEWEGLQGRGADDHEAVRRLTARIDAALQAVTVNLERWEDAPLVEMAEAVYAAEFPTNPSPAARVGRTRNTTAALALLRAERPGEWEDLARAVHQHVRTLRVLRMTPVEVKASASAAEAARWTFRQLTVLRTLLPIAMVGLALFYIPYRLTGFLADRAKPPRDIRATYKALIGIVLHLVWTVLLAGAAWWRWGWKIGLPALILLPIVAILTVIVIDMWRRASGEARRFFIRARRGQALLELRERQRSLAQRLADTWETLRV
ncbi:lysophospholipid acyltransferase family protein [Longimicrobium sp.]|uniref:lysophospholipid acyltransferase family protein n=1 Tax=Longimicrobium sp. TaxID=2029185 RepID=UPI003B3B65A4